jgi:MFS family permease
VHGLKIHEIAAIIGPVRGVLVAAGVMLGGILTDRLGRRNPRWRLYVPGIACLGGRTRGLGISAWRLTDRVDDRLCRLEPHAPASGSDLRRGDERGQGAYARDGDGHVLLLCSSLLGQFIGPLLVGWLNDRLARWYGPFAIRYSMLVLTVCVAPAALCFLFAARTLEADTRRAAGDFELPGGAT